MLSHVAARASIALLLALVIVDSPAAQNATRIVPAAFTRLAGPGHGRTASPRTYASHAVPRPAPTVIAPEALTGVVKKTCAGCHSEQRKLGNLVLANFDLASVANLSPEIAEKMIGKLRTGMMPPPGRPAGW
ncbi:MAG: hypothetical protein IPP90_19700 [Gemmatimonadaceae bacterium]|nr:hypothetical protein [Gemmatimonadaceae bacterium]